MKYDDDDTLIENPEADHRIDEVTLEKIQKIIAG